LMGKKSWEAQLIIQWVSMPKLLDS
jgi:hypothetical protein